MFKQQCQILEQELVAAACVTFISKDQQLCHIYKQGSAAVSHVRVGVSSLMGIFVFASGSTSTSEPRTRVLDDSTTVPPLLGTQQLFLWLPLIVVVIFTAVMIALIMIGRRKEPDPSQTTGNNKRLLLARARYEPSS